MQAPTGLSGGLTLPYMDDLEIAGAKVELSFFPTNIYVEMKIAPQQPVDWHSGRCSP